MSTISITAATIASGFVSTPLGPAGWHPDPLGRYEYRYFNGYEWTADVSRNGARLVDPAGIGGTPGTSRTTPRSGIATASFVVGLVSLLAAWMPFVFAIAAAGAVAGIALGVVGLKRSGRGFAVAGITLSTVALLLCVVGFLLTRVVLREVDAYVNPGPHTPTITSCAVQNGTLTMAGTLRNDDTVAHDYTVIIEYVVSGTTKGTDTMVVKALAPKAEAELRSDAVVVASGDAVCKVTVYGPTPFGVPQENLGTP